MYQQFLKTGLEAVAKAGEVIKKYYAAEINFTLKPDETPVTLADKEAETVIIDTIHKAFPNHTFIGEESATNIASSEFTWIIDPIDGTNSFIKHLPYFGTQLALYHGGEIVVGISNNPALNELCYATKGTGSFLNNKPLKVSKIATLKDASVSHGSVRSFANRGFLDALNNYSQIARAERGFGDFWGHQLVAQGKIDAMVEAKVKIWDIAAMSIIIAEAGGKVTDIQGNPITLDSTTIISSNGRLHKQIINVFQ